MGNEWAQVEDDLGVLENTNLWKSSGNADNSLDFLLNHV
jgi:hypothetical protein